MNIRARVEDVRPQVHQGTCSSVKVVLRLVNESETQTLVDGTAHEVRMNLADQQAWPLFVVGRELQISVSEVPPIVPTLDTTAVKVEEPAKPKVEEKPKTPFFSAKK